MASPEQQAQAEGELANAYRAGQIAVQAATVRDAIKLWPVLGITATAAGYGDWLDLMQALARRNISTLATLTTGFLTELWQTAERDGSPRLSIPKPPPVAQLETSMRVTSLVSYRRGLAVGMTEQQASRNALVEVSGSISRLVADAGREAIATTTTANQGRWHRVTAGGACAFCRMLAGRGAIYRADVNFASHDHCQCSMAGSFGRTLPAVDYTPSSRRISDADRARVRAWLSAHPDAA